MSKRTNNRRQHRQSARPNIAQVTAPALISLPTMASEVTDALSCIARLHESCRRHLPDLDLSALNPIATALAALLSPAPVPAPLAAPILSLVQPALDDMGDDEDDDDVPEAPARVYRTYTVSDRIEEIRSLYAGGTFAPSEYQLAVFDFILNGTGNGVVNAVAGSGKSTTLVQAARLIKVAAIFVAFNSHIVEALAAKLAGTSMTAKTMHSIGNGCLIAHFGGRPQVDRDKYKPIVKQAVPMVIPPSANAKIETLRGVEDALRDLTKFARLTLTDPTDHAGMRAMCDHFGIEVAPELEADLYRAAQWCLAKGEEMAERAHIIDFDDQVYLPHHWNLTPSKVMWVFVDEAQDLNAAQLDLAMKMLAPGGRMLAVGDPHQSIYGFAGADSEAFWKIAERTDAALLPLSICYRCPTSVINLAKSIVPAIEAAPDAPEGKVREVKMAEFEKEVAEGDLILCRLTAPLVSMCMSLIAAGKPAKVKGRNIGEQLAAVIRTVNDMPGCKWEDFGAYLQKYELAQVAKLSQREGNESAIETLQDRCQAVQVCYERFEASSAAELIRQIDGLFSEARTPIMLSTIHRAKGLENGRVYIAKPEKLPLSWPNQQNWEVQQEKNLEYVAYTRAMTELVFIRD